MNNMAKCPANVIQMVPGDLRFVGNLLPNNIWNDSVYDYKENSCLWYLVKKIVIFSIVSEVNKYKIDF